MSYVPAQNVSDAQVIIDDEGRTLGGGEWGAVDRHDEFAQVAVGDGRLVLHPDLDGSTPGIDPAAKAAAGDAADLEARRIELANYDAERLRAVADAGEYDASDDDVPTLRRRLTRRVEIPLTSAVESSTAESDASPVDAGDAPELPKTTKTRGGAR